MVETRIRLLVRGDDAGLCPAVTEAMLRGFHQGILRNTSIMVPAPAFPDVVTRLRNVSGLCLGLHATVNCEWQTPRWGPVLPSTEVPTLVESDGLFRVLPIDLHDAEASADEILAEVCAQLAIAREAGLTIAYLDHHCCFQWLHEYTVQRRLRAFTEQEGLIYEPALPVLPTINGEFATPVARFLAQLDAAPAGTYAHVFHPALLDNEMRAVFPRFPSQDPPGAIAQQRFIEFQVMTDASVVEYCQTHGIKLIRYTDLTPAELVEFAAS